ncbi:hypothetical protein OIU85_009119 [Salix viminalis]|uniref:Uncharacterized protein n=1 Tax=Salix viminalis TaxID=40686 RepID=A0A9Q0NZG7_SALVM|nr:hypothetical protein OIU85_009119 [Salix viminalis]
MILICSEIAPEIWRGSVSIPRMRCCKQLQNPLSVLLDVAISEDWFCLVYYLCHPTFAMTASNQFIYGTILQFVTLTRSVEDGSVVPGGRSTYLCRETLCC